MGIGGIQYDNLPSADCLNGAGGRIRTDDLSLTKGLLYQLSYTGLVAKGEAFKHYNCSAIELRRHNGGIISILYVSELFCENPKTAADVLNYHSGIVFHFRCYYT